MAHLIRRGTKTRLSQQQHYNRRLPELVERELTKEAQANSTDKEREEAQAHEP